MRNRWEWLVADNRNPTASLMAAAGSFGALNQQPVVSDTTQVYMGEGFARPTNPKEYVRMMPSQTLEAGRFSSTMWGMDKAKAYYTVMDPEYRAKAEAYAAWRAGGTPQPDWTVQSQYEDALLQANYMSKVTGTLTSPWDIMAMRMAQSEAPYGDRSGSGGGGGGGGYSGPVTSTQVQLSSASDAEYLVDQALTNYLGRQADEQERENFWALLKKGQAANPTTTVTTPGVGSSSSVTTGGFNEQQAATEFALSQKDSAEYMANTQYMDWLMESVSQDPTEGIASGL